MGTITISVTEPLPTFDSLYQAMLPNLTFPPTGFQWPPALPGIPTMFPSISCPNMSGVMAMGQLMTEQLLTSAFMMIKPISEFLGLAMSAIPKIPILNIGVDQLLTMSGDDLIAAAKGAMPSLPNLYFSLDIPDINVVQWLTQLKSSYLMSLAGYLQNIIKQVTDKIKIPGMPTLPTIPTMEDVKQMLIDQIPPPINDLRNVDLNALLANISIPGIPFDFSLPSPFIPNISMPEIDFNEMISGLYNSIVMMPMKTMQDFIMDKLSSVISLQLPTLVLVIPTIEIPIPEIPIPVIPPLPSIPDLPPLTIRGP